MHYTHYGIQSTKYVAPKIWDLVAEEIKNKTLWIINQITHFIKSWSPSDCPCQLCKTCIYIYIYIYIYMYIYNICMFFFLSGFSFTNTDNKQDSKLREGTIFYSTRTFRHLFVTPHVIWLLHIFLIATLVFEIYRLIELPFDWWCDVSFCLFTWFDSSFFIAAIWDGKPVESNSHRLSPLYYKRSD